jgi:transcriptional regulator with XRE-family HTH domain
MSVREQTPFTERRSFGRLLRSWRTTRGWSQRALADVAHVSARHLSFLESGRARPSRPMVMQFAVALDLPVQEGNALLHAAGFAPIWMGEGDGAVPPMLVDAIERMMAKHEPYPLYVANRARDVLYANGGTLRLLGAFLGDSLASLPLNVLRLMFDPALGRPFVKEWNRTATHMLALAHRDALRYPQDRQLAARLREVQAFDSFDRACPLSADTPPVFTVRLAKGSLRLAFFTTSTTFGGPQTPAIEELCIESWFPLDAETEATCVALASESVR